MLGHYENPSGLKDEDKFFRFFTKTELVFMIIVIMPSLMFCRSAFASGDKVAIFFAFLFTFLLCGGMLVLLKVKVPEKMYLMGSGRPLYILIARFIRKKMQPRVLYIKNTEERIYH